MDKRKRILNRDINDPPGSFRFCLVPECNSQGKDMYDGFCGRHRNWATELPVPYPDFCLHPEKCKGKSSCPRELACND